MIRPSIWAVVPAFNRPDAAMKCLEALLGQTAPLDGVLLVDNSAANNIGAAARERFGAAVTVHSTGYNSGPAGGFAAGLEAALRAGAEWVWLMDDDACPRSDALERLLRCPVFALPSSVALSSLKEGLDGTAQKWEAVMDRGSLRLPDEGYYGEPWFAVDGAAFAALLVRASAIHLAGLPDARYFSWFADYEFCLRLREHGEIACVPSSRVVHDDDVSRQCTMVRGRLRPGLPVFLKLCTGLRNRTFYAARRDGRLRAAAGAAARFLRMSAGIALWDDRKLLRVRLLARAMTDGLRGRLGPFDPEIRTA